MITDRQYTVLHLPAAFQRPALKVPCFSQIASYRTRLCQNRDSYRTASMMFRQTLRPVSFWAGPWPKECTVQCNSEGMEFSKTIYFRTRPCLIPS